MNDLIKRIEALVVPAYWLLHPYETRLLHECKAEIERLSKPYVPMTDKLRETAQGVLDSYCQLDYPADLKPSPRLCLGEGLVKITAIEALREALAEPSPIDALIAEIDELTVYNSERRYNASELDYDSMKAILDKYRSAK